MIGVDLVHLPEFARQLELGGESFLTRAFQPTELVDRRVEHLAGLWAAKEAVFKATGEDDRLAILISHEPSGRPVAQVGSQQIEISISHHGDYAIAIASA